MTKRDVAEIARKSVLRWLYLVAVLIFAMVLLGGLTRLTESGLSMVDWRPLLGAVPPLNETQWQAVFNDYQQYPEYQQHNVHMSLSEFKFIFFMEYGHRLLGRIIGLAVFLPLFYFCIRRYLSAKAVVTFVLMLVLGGLQGVVGWYMVKSGLVDIPHVSQYRLVLHLTMAIGVLSYVLWCAFDLEAEPPPGQGLARLYPRLLGILILLGVQITSGGFVAGLKAGFAFNTWPAMNGRLIPEGLFSQASLTANLFEDIMTVQFIHRNLALVVAATLLYHCIRYRRLVTAPRYRNAFLIAALLVGVQVLLGIGTLVMIVPVSLASAHQAVAILLWCTWLFLCHQSRHSPINAPE